MGKRSGDAAPAAVSMWGSSVRNGARRRAALALCAGLLAAPSASATDRSDSPAAREPCAHHEPLRQPFFGDIHVHTRYSFDAHTQGTRATPADAYRFAQGEPLGIQPFDEDGRPLRQIHLARPLDFAAVTDHAELFGEIEICETPGLAGYNSIWCRVNRRFPRLAFFAMNTVTTYPSEPRRRRFCGPDGIRCLEAARRPWQEMQDAADDFYDRSEACSFTTFVGYEWTGGPRSNNIHRNVIFRNEVVPALPTSYLEEPTAEGLWDALERDCLAAGTGCDALSIPHNSNLSGGLFFALDPDARSADAARRRAAFEPLVEVMQHKGDSECSPDVAAFGAPDELCAFEKLPYQNFAAKFVSWFREDPPPANYVRTALLEGLRMEAEVGANPFAFGLVAGTDTHLAAPGLVEEDADYPGHGGAGTPAPQALPVGFVDDVEFNPGGLAVLWAEENSRDALFDAMRRREAYGTSGPRLVVRVFAGFDLPPDLCSRSGAEFARAGYAGGVPMGGELTPEDPAGDAKPFRVAVWALRDPGLPDAPGVPLERIQIVKGWIEDDEPREAVIDIARDDAGDRALDAATCRADGSGADALCAVWEDPDFHAASPAFWYARVLEHPTCRWTAKVCLEAGVSCADPNAVPKGYEACCDPELPRTIQERAWASPIWWRPGAIRAEAP